MALTRHNKVPMIRLLVPHDHLFYRDLRLLSRQSNPDSFISTFDYENNLPSCHFESLIRENTKPPIFGIYGYFSDQHLVGHLQLSSEYFEKQSHLVNLYELFVHPDYRRQQIASQLIAYAQNLISTHTHLEQLHLKVMSTNLPAIRLYQKLGFKHFATRPHAIKTSTGTYLDELLLCLAFKA